MAAPASSKRTVKGEKPKINEAHEFLEIAKNFKRPQELLREALSNSWDAKATTASIEIQPVTLPGFGSGRRKQRVNVKLWDDGEGMGETEIHYFFNLGDSHKPKGAIGSKGHGTKIYYKSQGVQVATHKAGERVTAEMKAPWEKLLDGHVPPYDYDVEADAIGGRGTTISISAFDALPKEFEDLNEVTGYLQWNTVFGSVAEFLGAPGRSMQVTLRLPGSAAAPTFKTGFTLPSEQTDLSKGTSDIVRFFPASRGVDCGETSSGQKVTVDFRAILLGDNARGFIPKTYEQNGMWLCKDYILIERFNDIIEDVTGGEYWYRSFLIFANCQQFDLTANRNEIQADEAWELAREKVQAEMKKVWEDSFTKQFFDLKKREDELQGQQKRQAEMQERFNEFGKRPSLSTKTAIPGLLPKVPRNEAETTLVLQAMISAKVGGVDFRLGEYDAHEGTDALVEFTDKGIPRLGWLEVVRSLAKLFAWDHDFERIHKVACWDLGKVKAQYTLKDGSTVKYQKEGEKHSLVWERRNGSIEVIPVYVLGEMLGASTS